jgi:hypothetical protein
MVYLGIVSHQDFIRGLELPKAFVIDRELSLLNSIKALFTTTKIILCVWHINGNVAKKVKRILNEESWIEFLKQWNNLIKSNSEQLFEENWNQLQTSYSDFPEIITYLSTVWIPLREHFCHYAINEIPHLDNTTTQRVEGMHAALKSYLGGTRIDIKGLKDGFNRFITKQLRDYRKNYLEQKVKVPTEIPSGFFNNVLRKISIFALSKLMGEYEKALAANEEQCSNFLRPVLGLPCSHILRTKIENGEQLQLEDISNQWHLDKPFVEEFYEEGRVFENVQDPIVVEERRGRPDGVGNSQNSRNRPSRSCGNCGEPGHNRRTCTVPRNNQ